MTLRSWSLALFGVAFAAACGGNTTDERTASGGSGGQLSDARAGTSGASGSGGASGSSGSGGASGSSGSGGTSGSSGSAGTAGRGGSSGSGFDAAGGTGGDPQACERQREDYRSAVERNTRCNLSLGRAPCGIAAPGECCSLSVDLPSQAEEMALRVAQLIAACGTPACPEIVCPLAPSSTCEPSSSGSPTGHCR